MTYLNVTQSKFDLYNFLTSIFKPNFHVTHSLKDINSLSTINETRTWDFGQHLVNVFVNTSGGDSLIVSTNGANGGWSIEDTHMPAIKKE